MYGNAQHEACKDVSCTTDQAASKRPTGCFPTRNVARANDEIGVLDSIKEVWQVMRVVREVCIHLKCGIVVVGNSVFEACNVGCAQAKFASTMQNVYTLVFFRDAISQLACSVRRIVIYNQDICFGRVEEDVFQKQRKILCLIVGRDDYKRLQ